MRVLISGSTGLIGSALVESLTLNGHSVTRLVRTGSRSSDAGSPSVEWDIRAGAIDVSALNGLDAVVHLAGENLATGRWTAARRKRILESRTAGTALIARALASLATPPRVFVSASAVGIYGDAGDTPLDETSPVGDGFLADVCQQWEAAAGPARGAGIRTVHPRFGVVLAPEGGALRKMLPAFRFGVGGRVGSGRQWMSWVSLPDAVGALERMLESDISGPVNVTAPNPVTNAEFASTLGAVLRRPAVLPVPAVALKLAFGDMARETLLASQKAVPKRLQADGYGFRHPTIGEALAAAL